MIDWMPKEARIPTASSSQAKSNRSCSGSMRRHAKSPMRATVNPASDIQRASCFQKEWSLCSGW